MSRCACLCSIPSSFSWDKITFCCRVWDVNTGEVLNTLIHHNEAVLHLRFSNGLMVTCSKDRSIAVWDMASPTDITLRRVLVGHRAAVNVVDFDDKYIVSASGDRTIKVSWRSSSQGPRVYPARKASECYLALSIPSVPKRFCAFFFMVRRAAASCWLFMVSCA